MSEPADHTVTWPSSALVTVRVSFSSDCLTMCAALHSPSQVKYHIDTCLCTVMHLIAKSAGLDVRVVVMHASRLNMMGCKAAAGTGSAG